MISRLFTFLNNKLNNNSKGLGKIGEEKAVQYLKQKKHRIKCVNFKTRLGEIDIISELPGLIIFTEVKAGTVNSYRHPLYAVTKKKTQRIQKAAGTYIRKYQLKNLQPRYDIITVIKDDNVYQINHYENGI